MKDCECDIAGFCKRHGIHKGKKWHHLCQTSEQYREAWDRNVAGVDVERKNARNEDSKRKLAELGRKAWQSLFTAVFTLSELKKWERAIPAYGCRCKAFYSDWIEENPVEIDASGRIAFYWKWKLKSAVNAKLGHADLSHEEALAFWCDNKPTA